MVKNIKQIEITGDGLDAKMFFQDEEIKMGKLESTEELSKAHCYIKAILCEQFFELANIVAKEKGISLYELFEDEKHLDTAMINYLNKFMTELVECAAIHSKANWELFEKQKTNNNANGDA